MTKANFFTRSRFDRDASLVRLDESLLIRINRGIGG